MIVICVVLVTALLVGFMLGVVVGVRRMPGVLATMDERQLGELADKVLERRG